MAAFTINLGIGDLQRSLGAFQTYDAQTQARLQSTVQSSTSAIMLGAKRRARVRSGQLVKNITMSYDGVKNVGIVRAKSPHAHLVEYGARAATERPKNKKALTVGDGFAASANIPARQAYPFMRPAFEDEKPNLVRGTETAVKP
ncbi:MAG: HK97 gp10 family phage protein [Negativicutes bacterium]|nr:HK97 gp10 family phage protein [Negativicutes bacterium]